MSDTKMKEPRRRGARGGRSRWSAVDTVILLLVLVAIAGIVYRVIYAAREDQRGADPAQYEVYFEVEETHEHVFSELRPYDPVYLYDSDVLLGYIAVYKDAATEQTQIYLTVSPAEGATGYDRATATGALICTSGLLQDGALLVGTSGRYLSPGSVVQVRTDRAVLTLRITEIQKRS